MNKDRISIGDFVSINFNNAQLTLSKKARVEYVPLEARDCWIVKDEETGQIHYISESCTITKISNE